MGRQTFLLVLGTWSPQLKERSWTSCSLLSGRTVLILSLTSVSRSVVSDSLRPHGLHPAKLLCPWNSPGKHTGVGGHSLLQGIFPTQGSNPGLPHCRWTLPSEPPGKPRSLALGVEDVVTELCKWPLSPDAHQIFYVEWTHIVPTYGHYCNYRCWCDSYTTDCFKWIPEALLAFFSLYIFSVSAYPSEQLPWLAELNI